MIFQDTVAIITCGTLISWHCCSTVDVAPYFSRVSCDEELVCVGHSCSSSSLSPPHSGHLYRYVSLCYVAGGYFSLFMYTLLRIYFYNIIIKYGLVNLISNLFITYVIIRFNLCRHHLYLVCDAGSLTRLELSRAVMLNRFCHLCFSS